MFKVHSNVINFLFIILLFTTILTQNANHKKKFDHVDINSLGDNELFQKFIGFYGRAYSDSDTEGRKRFIHFQRNLKHVREINKQGLPYTLALNKLADLSMEEYSTKLGGRRDKNSILEVEKKFPHRKSLLSTKVSKLKSKQTLWTPIDWTSAFLEARSQGTCGSCWAFSVLGVVEAGIAINGGVKQYLSTQYLINCDPKDQGCNGGAFPYTFEFLINNGTIVDTALPYVAAQSTCAANINNAVFTKITKYDFCSNNSNLKKCSEDIIYGFLQKGPIAVGIDASSRDFQSYSSGIYTVNTCNASNHAVILAGYGKLNNLEYWLIRNSWGVGWGENGFIKVLKNSSNNNSCFITDEAFLPLFN